MTLRLEIKKLQKNFVLKEIFTKKFATPYLNLFTKIKMSKKLEKVIRMKKLLLLLLCKKIRKSDEKHQNSNKES